MEVLPFNLGHEMANAWVRCERCGEYVPLKDYPNGHVCGVPVKEEVDLQRLSHAEVLDWYMLHSEEIEPNMVILMKELPIFRGRIDLVGRDKDGVICLIEIVHRSRWARASWIKKLKKYRSYLRHMGSQIFYVKGLKVRLLLKRTGHITEDVTNSVPSF